MFGNGPKDKKPSLLMQSNAAGQQSNTTTADDNVVSLNGGLDAVSTHRRAKAARKTVKKNPFLAALSGQTNSPKVEQSAYEADQGIADIERDIDDMMRHADEPNDDYAHSYAPAPAFAQQDSDAFKPLLDPAIIFNSIWKWRWPIAGLTILGGIAGSFIAISTPQTYTAYTQILVDPRAIELVENDLTPEFLGTESALAIVDSQLEAVYSTPVLERVIEKTNLDIDTEFNGKGDDGTGLLDGISFVRSLFSDETPVDTSDRITLENLRKAISVERLPRRFVFSITADSYSPRRAAEIANALREAFVEDQQEKQSGAARNATSIIGGQLDALKKAVETAENQAAAYARDNGLKRVEGLTLNDTALVALVGQASEAKSATVRARSLAQAAQAATVDQVVTGGLPPELVNPALTTFRAQFSSLSQNAASLEQSLGPRHPRLANALAARESARSEIDAELQRIVAGTQADLRRAIQNEQQLTAQLNAARSGAGDENQALIKLRELEAEIETAQSIYKTALLRSRETEQLGNIATVNATTITEAQPPLHPSSLSRKIIAGSGAVSGMMLGLGLAFLFGLRDSLRADSAGNGQPLRGPTPPPSPKPNNPAGPRARHTRQPSQSSGQSDSQVAAKNENNMYPGAPYSPYVAMQQPVQQQPMHQPQPMPAYAPQPMMQPQQAYAPQQFAQPAMMQPAPYPQPQPQMAMQYPPMPVAPMMQQPVVQPQYQQAAPQMMQQQFVDPHTQFAAQQEEAELAELRASVREIRDVVDHLAQSRSTRRRFG